jgi:D-3-phosphoglycerate dehydrogenase
VKTIAVVDDWDELSERQAKEHLPGGFRIAPAQAGDLAAQVRAAAEADYLIVSGVWLRAPVIEAGRRLKLIQKLGVGVDKIDLAAAERARIPVAITAGENSSSVGEAALMLMLALYRQLREADQAVRAGRWPKMAIAARSRELLGRRLGIVGLGRTGRQVARRARAFAMEIVYHDIVAPPPEVERELGARPVALDELLATSDVVTLHVPWTRQTHHMIGEAALARMQRSAILINTSRGEVVDEAALDRALRSGAIAGAGLDVFEGEPVAGPRPLFESPNLVTTPHTAGVTVDCLARMWRHAYANCVTLESGGALAADDLVDLEALRSG